MLPLNLVFLVVISILVLVIVVSLFFNVRLFSTEKIQEIFHFTFPEYEFERCVTKFLSGFSDLDLLCKICTESGKRIKKSCYCFVVYSSNVVFNECTNLCYRNKSTNNLWLIRYSVSMGKSVIEC